MDIPTIGATCNVGALLKGNIHLKRIDIDLKEIGLAKNKQGNLNVDSLKVVEGQDKTKKTQKPAKDIGIQMDVVNLSIGRVVNKDYSTSGPAVIKVYDINLKKTYKNINSAQQLAALIIAEPLKAAGIQGLKIYGIAMLTGVAALPVAVAFMFTGNDYAQADLDISMYRAYEVGLEVLKKSGTVKKENKTAGGPLMLKLTALRLRLNLKNLTIKPRVLLSPAVNTCYPGLK